MNPDFLEYNTQQDVKDYSVINRELIKRNLYINTKLKVIKEVFNV